MFASPCSRDGGGCVLLFLFGSSSGGTSVPAGGNNWRTTPVTGAGASRVNETKLLARKENYQFALEIG
jgi:hypothetical protein